ncbi:DnaJ domain-containing protein [Sulfurospirillum barnesii]|uniref:DnaJ-class molecular chaperone with C-terminal Zn finger domain n=1 Tax=Sulfurospirillum barnesii (strain ATCC 700032 / DSM 10660 / SES-3) TaxID=760154 RepID=I3XZB4_SULBS|nr:DnaJ domain-containing protein [Sulfurospirillum barnesii]AFL69288.1 DnaJ-class molecular chaperone with C-terminal Zn finger domain [Sulfurospirillum barnesii SES-3]
MCYETFQKALDTLGVIGGMDKKEIRRCYLALSKKYHPDVHAQESGKFQEIHEAYTLLMDYAENFRFRFSQQEFQEQFPFWDDSHSDWHTKI